MVSTNKVQIIPQLNTLERDELVSPVAGTLIYNIDVGVNQTYNGSTWVDNSAGTLSLQTAYDGGSIINMDSNVDLQVFSSTSDLAFSVIENGALSGIQCNRALQIDYPGIGGPILFFQHLTPTAPGNLLLNIGGQTQASNGFSKTFETLQVQVVNDSDAAFEAETIFKNIINNSSITCFSTGVENKSFRDLNMQNNPITNAGSINGLTGFLSFVNPGEFKIYTSGSNILNLESDAGLNLTNITSGPMVIDHQGSGNKIDLNGSLLPGEMSITSNGAGVLIQELTTGNNIGITTFSSGMVTNTGVTQIRNTDASNDLNIVKQNGGNINLDVQNTGNVIINNSDLNLNSNNIINVNGINGLTPQGGLSAATANGVIITATTTEQSLLPASYVGNRLAPANTFKQGDSFTAVLAGNFSSNNGDTLTLRLKGGPTATDILSSIVIPLNNSSGVYFEIEIDFLVRQIGGPTVADLAINYDFSYNQASGGNFQGQRLCEINNSTFDTTISNLLDITAQFSSTSSSNSIETLLSTLGKTY